jgi:hypothetical protein
MELPREPNAATCTKFHYTAGQELIFPALVPPWSLVLPYTLSMPSYNYAERHSPKLQCPLWVITGHREVNLQCPLYPRKRTSPPK